MEEKIKAISNSVENKNHIYFAVNSQADVELNVLFTTVALARQLGISIALAPPRVPLKSWPKPMPDFSWYKR